MTKDLGILTKSNCFLLVIDMQEKFRPVIHGFNEILKNISKLTKAFEILKIPIIITEQYPKGLGKTIKELSIIVENNIKSNKLNNNKIEKIQFSCFDNNNFSKTIKKFNKKNIIVVGVEAHVCVLRTILDGIKNKYNMHMVVDAVSSRKKLDKDIAVARAKQSSAFLTTTEAVIFQLINSSKDKEFKKINEIIK